MISAKYNSSNLGALINKVNVVNGNAIGIAKELTASEIIRKSREGMDADGNPFPPYKPSTVKQRKKLGLQTSKKTLFRTGGLYDSVKKGAQLVGNILTVSEAYQKIAHGQMYHRKWKEHNKFFLAGDDIGPRVAEQTAQMITSA